MNLSNIGVTEDDKQAIKEFASSLALNQSVVEVDFSANHIGTLLTHLVTASSEGLQNFCSCI